MEKGKIRRVMNKKGCNFCNGSVCITNSHIEKNPYSLEIIKDSDGAALALLENNFYCLGVFDINFCPICGKNKNQHKQLI